MKLFILRHGEAEPRASTDAQRPLTSHGREQVQRMVQWLKPQLITTILVSPYLRAQQTAELAREALGISRVETVDWLTPDVDPNEAMGQLDTLSAEGTYLLVSHQPLVGMLSGLLVHGQANEALPFGTASLAELDGVAAWAGGMSLVRLRHASDR